MALAGLAGVWALLVVTAPWLLRSGRPAGVVLATAAYAIGAGVCHQQPERSFSAAGRIWPVCSRCSGLYVGAALGVLAGVSFLRRRAAVTSLARWRILLIVAAAPTLASWLLEVAGGPATPMVWRFLLASSAGATVGALLSAIALGRVESDAPPFARTGRLVR